MSKMAKLILAMVFVGAIVAIALVVNKKDSTTDNTNKTPNSSESSTSEDSSSTDNSSADVAMTITYDGSNFTESADNIMAGQAVKVVNNSSKSLDFDSDPHPVHTDNTELNAGNIEPGESKTFIIDKKGTWGYHNHLDASQNGSITVN